MSVLVVGMSHKSAPLDVLEKVALDPDASIKLSQLVLETPFVTESVVVSTCNRVEIYVEAERFHGAVEEVSRLLAEHSGLDRDEFVRHVYVHFDEAAVAHLFGVAAGMDSMILGESQILGQVRDALLTSQTEATVGPALNALFQQALRIGKRGHAETGIDRLAPSIVTASLTAAGEIVNADGTHFLIAGAGTMAKLAVRTLIERGVTAEQIAVANRTYERAQDLAVEWGVRVIRWDDMDDELAAVDVLISCTGANGVVFDRQRVEAARGRIAVLIDLALPRDIASDARDIDGISLIDLLVLSKMTENAELAADVRQVRSIVEDEVRTFLLAKAASHITPTVVALRTMATDVVDAEVARIESRLPDMTDEDLAAVRQALGRVADKLIHTPTVRVQQLVDSTGGLTYAEALADLFALDQAAVDAVTRVGGEPV
ncbi:MAG: glutamyl-tRNA reductase [Aeromicrobium sp.]